MRNFIATQTQFTDPDGSFAEMLAPGDPSVAPARLREIDSQGDQIELIASGQTWCGNQCSLCPRIWMELK